MKSIYFININQNVQSNSNLEVLNKCNGVKSTISNLSTVLSWCFCHILPPRLVSLFLLLLESSSDRRRRQKTLYSRLRLLIISPSSSTSSSVISLPDGLLREPGWVNPTHGPHKPANGSRPVLSPLWPWWIFFNYIMCLSICRGRGQAECSVYECFQEEKGFSFYESY